MFRKSFYLGLIVCSLISPLSVTAIDDNDKVDSLLVEISALEKELDEKRFELNKLLYGEKEDGIEWLQMDMLATKKYLTSPAYVELVKIGIDYSKNRPELHIILYTKNVTAEYTEPNRGLLGSLIETTDFGEDYVVANEYYTYLAKDGDRFIVGDRSDLPNKIAPGWDGYFRTIYPLENPEAIYTLIAEGYSAQWKIAIAGTDDEFGTILDYKVE